MKRILLATTAIAIAGAANAADIRAPITKAPVMAPAYSWTGFYVGVNAGLGVGENPSNLLLPAVLISEGFAQSPFGFFGGVQAGFNWQFGNWVLGVEGDIQASSMKDSQTCILACFPTLQRAAFEQKLDWFGTARARVGYATGPILAYYTGGFAFADASMTITEALGGATGAFTFSDTLTGWTIGSGVEAALGGNWTGKVEYLYLDLGSLGGAYTIGGFAHTTASEIRSHIFRAGLNYRIGGTPMASAYPAANWSGFYIGGNGGSGTGRNEASHVVAPVPGTGQDFFVLAPRGFIGGGQAGFNWQTGNVVFGLEADFQGSSQKDNNCLFNCVQTVAGPRFSTEQSMPWFGTARGRLGYSVGPSLFYLTAGVAYGQVETTINATFGGASATVNLDGTRTGWTAGGGLEQPFNLFGLLPGNNWTLKTEYLYVDLGSTTTTYPVGGAATTFTSDATSHVFRTGINYRFGGGPVVAKY